MTMNLTMRPVTFLVRPKLLPQSAPAIPAYRPADMPGDKYFFAAIGIALALHLTGAVIWQLVPRTQVIDIPVRPLNIKLGDGDPLSVEEMKAIAPGAANNSDVEKTLASLVRDVARDQARAETVAGSLDQAMKDLNKAASAEALGQSISTAEQPRQFVREVPAPASVKNSAAVLRYEQTISLWVQKFKLYPEEARKQGMEGETVVRVRIDRQGNVRHYILERSTGHSELDRAAIDMIRRANPVPAVPADYPAGELLEFLIPVNFRLQ